MPTETLVKITSQFKLSNALKTDKLNPTPILKSVIISDNLITGVYIA